MSKVLTVTVPAFNAERCLSTNLDSLLNQGEFAAAQGLTQEEMSSFLEILIIDDGSSDTTGDIADRYEQEHLSVVRVLHKRNGGHGSCINAGIRAAGGRYFKVVDSDDWVDPAAFARLVRFLCTADSDLVASGFYWRFERKGDVSVQDYPRRAEIKEPFSGVVYGKEYSFDEVADHIYLKMHHLATRTAIYRDHSISIDEHMYYVDTEYNLFPVPYIETVCFLPDFVYQYRLGREGQSMSRENMRMHRRQYRKVLAHLLRFYSSLRQGEIPCSEEKIRYIEGLLARIYASYIKIVLGMPCARGKRSYLRGLDDSLRRNYPEIYRANRNRALVLLRISGFGLTGMAEFAVKLWRGSVY